MFKKQICFDEIYVICLETFILDYSETENQQLFDGIIDVTLFDEVEGLDFWPKYLEIIFRRHYKTTYKMLQS